MPRELQPPQPSHPPVLTASPEVQSPDANENMGLLDSEMILEDWSRPGEEGHMQDMDVVNMLRRFDETEHLHPYTSALTIQDLDACVALEQACFPESERASPDKIRYRLTVCPFLCLGLFTSTTRQPNETIQASFNAARAPDSANSAHKSLLIGYVMSTLTSSDSITDESMSIPTSFSQLNTANDQNLQSNTADMTERSAKFTPGEDSPAVPAKEPPPLPSKDSTIDEDLRSDVLGHLPLGRTLAIHSVCILPGFRKLSLGKILFRGYLQRMEGAGIADTAALLAHPGLAEWYQGKFGFVDHGASSATFGGGNWRDLRYEFSDPSSSV